MQAGMLTRALFKYNYGHNQTMQECHRLHGEDHPLWTRTTALTAVVFLLCGVLLTIRRTGECQGFNLTCARATLRHWHEWQGLYLCWWPSLPPSSGFLRRGLRALSFLSLQIHRGLATVSPFYLPLWLQRRPEGMCGRHSKSAFWREEEAKFTLCPNQTGIPFEVLWQVCENKQIKLAGLYWRSVRLPHFFF